MQMLQALTEGRFAGLTEDLDDELLDAINDSRRARPVPVMWLQPDHHRTEEQNY